MTDPQREMSSVARGIIDANIYMVLGSADDKGRPWVSPVFYAADGYDELYWMSTLEASHSQNLALRPDVSIVIFDSRISVGESQAVYMSARAAEVSDAHLSRSLQVYPGPATRGGRPIPEQDLRGQAPHRLYRAAVTHHWVLCRETESPCRSHGKVNDHRMQVRL